MGSLAPFKKSVNGNVNKFLLVVGVAFLLSGCAVEGYMSPSVVYYDNYPVFMYPHSVYRPYYQYQCPPPIIHRSIPRHFAPKHNGEHRR